MSPRKRNSNQDKTGYIIKGEENEHKEYKLKQNAKTSLICLETLKRAINVDIKSADSLNMKQKCARVK